MERALLNLLGAKDPDLSMPARREAFGDVVSAHQDAAFSVAYSILGDPHVAQDAAIEGFIDAWRNLESLQDTAAFGGWLRKLVRSRALRQLRDLSRNTVSLQEAEPSASMKPREPWMDLRSALLALPEAEREVIVLHYIAGLTRGEVASLTGTSLVTTKKRLAQALSRLRKETIRMSNDEIKPFLPSRDDKFRRQTLLLTGQFAELLAGGRPILQAFDDCIAQAGDGLISDIFRDMRQQVTQGKPMADAMRRHPQVFDAHDAELVFVGEEMGRLDDVLKRMAQGEQLRSADALRVEYSG